MTEDARPKLAALKKSSPSALAPRRRRRRWLWVVALLTVVAAIAAALLTRKPEVKTSSVMTAYPSSQYAVLTASGYVVAQRRAAVSSKATGRLLECPSSRCGKHELRGKLERVLHLLKPLLLKGDRSVHADGFCKRKILGRRFKRSEHFRGQTREVSASKDQRHPRWESHRVR